MSDVYFELQIPLEIEGDRVNELIRDAYDEAMTDLRCDYCLCGSGTFERGSEADLEHDLQVLAPWVRQLRGRKLTKKQLAAEAVYARFYEAVGAACDRELQRMKEEAELEAEEDETA